MKNILVLGAKISVTNLKDATSYVEDCIKGRRKTYICIAPVSTIVDAQENDEYRKIINNSGMTTPDGMPLVWLGRLKGERTIGRTYGPDFMLALCEKGQKRGYKHYLYGGEESTCDLLKSVLEKKFPDIDIIGQHTPPFRPLHAQEDGKVIDEINRQNPDILWVGLGSPKQDYWMYEHRDKLNAPVMIGVGAAFDFIAGIKRQAPRWMQKCGLEWFFRLCCEPKRLWKRYLIGNTRFIYLLIKHAIKSRLDIKA